MAVDDDDDVDYRSSAYDSYGDDDDDSPVFVNDNDYDDEELMITTGKIELKNRVQDGFEALRTASLPEEFASDPNVQWILRYDSLDRRRVRNTDSDDIDDIDDFGPGYFVASILQNRIAFYFSSLFHIGRQIKVSTNAFQDCNILRDSSRDMIRSVFAIERALASSNLDQSNSRISSEEINIHLNSLCDNAIDRHVQNIEIANQWWINWREEIQVCRGLITEFEEFAPRERFSRRKSNNRWIRPAMRLVNFVSQSSNLQQNMIAQGVKFKISPQENPTRFDIFGLSIPLIILLIASFSEDDMHSHMLIHEIERSIHEQRKINREKELSPIRDSFEKGLIEKYGNVNPFFNYPISEKAIDDNYLKMIIENTHSKIGESSFLSDWKKLISPSIYKNSLISLFYNHFSLPERAEILFRLFDSYIKCNINPKMSLSIDDNVQNIFIDNILSNFSDDILGAIIHVDNLKSIPSLGYYSEILQSVIMKLNNIGYELTMPGSKMLTVLYNKAVKNISVS